MPQKDNISIATTPSNSGEIVLYQPDDDIRVEVRLDKDTVWLTQQQIADLFGVRQPAISKHLSNIFKEGELDKNSVYSILEYTAADGKVYNTQFYQGYGQETHGYNSDGNQAGCGDWGGEVRTYQKRQRIFPCLFQ